MIIPFLIVLAGIAYLLLNPDQNKKAPLNPIIFPMGLAVFIVVNIFGITLKLTNINHFLMAMVIFVLLWKMMKRQINWIQNLLLPIAITGVASIIVYYFNSVLMTYDSFKLYQIGVNLAHDFNLQNIGEDLSTWGFGGMFPSYLYEIFSQTQHLNKFFHMVFFATAYLMFVILAHLHPIKNKRDLIFIVTAIILYFTMPMVIRANGYIHNNGMVALFLLSAVYCYLLKLPKSFLISVVLFSLTRVELPIVGLMILFLFIDGFAKKDQKHILITWMAVILIWNIFILFNAPEDNSISSAKKHLCMLLLICGGFAITWIKTFTKAFAAYFDHEKLELLIGFCFVFALLFPFTSYQRHLQTSANNTLKNILSMKNYGSVLFFMLFYFITYFQRNIKKEVINIRTLALFYFATIIGLSIFRLPYKLNWGDSANRMMLHLIPLIVIVAVVSFFQFTSTSSENSKKT